MRQSSALLVKTHRKRVSLSSVQRHHRSNHRLDLGDGQLGEPKQPEPSRAEQRIERRSRLASAFLGADQEHHSPCEARRQRRQEATACIVHVVGIIEHHEHRPLLTYRRQCLGKRVAQRGLLTNGRWKVAEL